MARGTLALHTLGRTGTTQITYADANSTDKHQFDNSSGKAFLLVKNGSASPVNITIQTPAVAVDSLAVDELVVAVAAGKDAVIGPFPKGIYNQSANDLNKVFVDPSASAVGSDIQLAAIQYG